MMPRWVLRVVQVAPIVVLVFIVALWFSTPDTLRSAMTPTAASSTLRDELGLDSSQDDLMPTDRRTVAREWLEADARKNASRDWADVQLRDAARRTAMLSNVRYAPPRSAYPATAPVESDDVASDPLREWARRFPEARVYAYTVDQPTMPPVVVAGGLPIDNLPPDPFAVAWTTTVGKPGTAFNPSEWRGYSDNATGKNMSDFDATVNDTWFYYYTGPIDDSGAIYRSYVFCGVDYGDGYNSRFKQGSPGLANVHERIKTTIDRDADWCGPCHENSLGPPGVGGAGLVGLNGGNTPTTVYTGGPIVIEPKPFFTTGANTANPESIARAALKSALSPERHVYEATPDELKEVSRDPYASILWQQPEAGGKTMLFVAFYSKDPHAAYTHWRSSWPGDAFMQTRLWLAVEFPQLLAVLCTLLAFTLVGSPAAFVFERRITRRAELAEQIARVERDAHDRVYNRLGALAKRVEAVGGSDAVAAERLGDAARDIRSTVTDLQAILAGADLREGATAGDALVAQLRATVAAQASLHDIDVEFVVSGQAPDLPARLGWDLQCVLDEAITNAARHGGASFVRAELSQTEEFLVVEVSDDGETAGAAEDGSRGSTGIAGMNARLAVWGGDARLERGQSGSVLRVEVPFRPSESDV
jgi:two-component sensor histidine kinase